MLVLKSMTCMLSAVACLVCVSLSLGRTCAFSSHDEEKEEAVLRPCPGAALLRGRHRLSGLGLLSGGLLSGILSGLGLSGLGPLSSGLLSGLGK